MFEIVEGICNINEKVWGNHAGSYDDRKEAAYQIEEALEGFDDNNFDAMAEEIHDLVVNEQHRNMTATEFSRVLVENSGYWPEGWDNTDPQGIPDVDRFDKALDAIYFAIGSMHKLGLTPHQIVEGLQVVHSANLAKTGDKDSEGKVIKPTDFVPPEDKLQLILNAREIDD